MRTNWEWEQFGEDIRRTVQDAVDSRDFRRLNQTITDTVNSAFHEFTDGMRNPRGGYQYQKADYGTGRQSSKSLDKARSVESSDGQYRSSSFHDCQQCISDYRDAVLHVD